MIPDHELDHIEKDAKDILRGPTTTGRLAAYHALALVEEVRRLRKVLHMALAELEPGTRTQDFTEACSIRDETVSAIRRELHGNQGPSSAATNP